MKCLVWLMLIATCCRLETGAGGVPLELSIRHEPEGIDAPSSGPILLSWDAVPGRSYNVQAAEAPRGGTWVTLNPAPIVAQANRQEYRDLVSPEFRFYRVAELSPPVAVNLVGICEQAWLASDAWVPATISHVVSGDKTLITLGAWWDGSFPAMPTDTSGVFTEAVRRSTNNTRWPLRVQVAYQANAVPGFHEVKPQALGGSGDGYFLLLEAAGVSASEVVRDKGYATDFRPSSSTPVNPIQEISVATEGDTAREGDLALAIVVMDTARNPDINITLPEGWTSLGYNDAVVDNIGYRACYRIVTTSGRQTVTWSWTDGATFVAEAGIVVFRAAANE